LRMLDSLFVKQIPSLTEGKLSEEWQIYVKLIDSKFSAILRIATEAKYDIYNDRNERIFHAFESKYINYILVSIIRINLNNYFSKKSRHFVNDSVVQLDEDLLFTFSTIKIKQVYLI
jgi:hypothetical protein